VANELILIVEDDVKSRKLVREVLRVRGYEIIEAETGEEGVGLAQERRPRLVLMDIRLPGIDGIQALGQLRADVATRQIPVMAMTASVMAGDRQRVLDAGFDDFLSKPINVKGFLAAVEQLLERHRSSTE
jgi:two-component system cell cycle response regulator DivK